MRNKLEPWQGKMLVMGERVTLINSFLTSVPLYMLSFYRIPSGVKENWTELGIVSYGMKLKIKINIIWLIGIWRK
jgi:hypothetical protein